MELGCNRSPVFYVGLKSIRRGQGKHKPLASLKEGGGSPCGLPVGVLLDPRTLPQSKIKDFCQPPQ